MRLVVVFCLATGAVLDAALGRYQGKKTDGKKKGVRIGFRLTGLGKKKGPG